MRVKKSELSKMAIELERGSARSPLFWWMVQHWKTQAEPGPRHRVDWSLQCARFIRLGVHDAAGKPPSLKVAKKTWAKAKAFLQEQAAAAAVPVAPKPAAPAPWGRSPVTGRRLPPDLTVPDAAPRPPPGPVATGDTHPPPAVDSDRHRPTSEDGGRVSKEDVRRRIEQLRASFRNRR